MPPLRIAVTGTQGQVVRSLLERAAARGVEVVAVGRPDLDLSDPASVHRALAASAPEAIVNAAAYTLVDRAEQEREAAFAVNGAGAGAVAAAAQALKLPLVHISTDYVFDGASERPYREEDATAPLGAYGGSKRAGEIAVAESGADYAILRTAWVYSPFGANFLKTMLRVARTRPEISVVADQIGNPTNALDIADGIIAVAKNLLASPYEARMRGVFHMTAAGETHWACFAEAIFEDAAAMGGPTAKVRKISTAEYPTPARRPANSRLDCAKLAAIHGVALPAWRSAVADCVRRVLAETAAASG
jgi:dTDP-4-dehydrorhamnose reductase